MHKPRHMKVLACVYPLFIDADLSQPSSIWFTAVKSDVSVLLLSWP